MRRWRPVVQAAYYKKYPNVSFLIYIIFILAKLLLLQCLSSGQGGGEGAGGAAPVLSLKGG